jgi:hypothetical protein
MTWPSTHVPGTMGFLIDRIDDELKRSGTINDRIQVAIVDAVNIYARERFRFNETFTTTFLTVGGQQNYNIFSDVNFPGVTGPLQLQKLDWLTITIPPAVFDMPRLQPEQILILTQTGTQMGQPYCYAFSNETIMLYPIPPTGTPGTGPVSQLGLLVGGSGYTPGTYAAIPATGGSGAGLTLNITVNSGGVVQSAQIANGGQGFQVGNVIGAILGLGSGFQMTVMAINATGQGPFLMSIGAHVNLPAPMGFVGSTGQDTTGNRWFIDGEKLIRSRAKYELAINVLKDIGPNSIAERMSPHPPEQNNGVVGASWDAYCMLSGEVNRLQARGMVDGMAF